MATPTEQTYTELQRAYNYFNAHLFDNQLPPCLITLQRKPRTRGYFSPGRFINETGTRTDEIAMNPQFFVISSIEESLSTLAHEMVHLQQYHNNTSGRRGYHNKSWADKMESIGLIPSTTGQQGGKKTGEKVTHYIEPGGMFESVCNELITESFELSWMDRFPPDEALIQLQQESEQATEESTISKTSEDTSGDTQSDSLEKLTTESNPNSCNKEEPEGLNKREVKADEQDKPAISTPQIIKKRLEKATSAGVDVAGAVERKKRKNASNRVKYTCTQCNTNVWGKPGLEIICGSCSSDDQVRFVGQ